MSALKAIKVEGNKFPSDPEEKGANCLVTLK